MATTKSLASVLAELVLSYLVCCRWHVSAGFIQPPAGNSVYGDPWIIGDTQTLEWDYQTSVSYEVQLCKQNSTSGSTICSFHDGLPAISSTQAQDSAHQSQTWTVSPAPFDLRDSNLFYFVIQPAAQTAISSAYIQFTDSGSDNPPYGGSTGDGSSGSSTESGGTTSTAAGGQTGGYFGTSSDYYRATDTASEPSMTYSSDSMSPTNTALPVISANTATTLSTATGKPLPTSTIQPNSTFADPPAEPDNASVVKSLRADILGVGIPILLIVLAILGIALMILNRTRSHSPTQSARNISGGLEARHVSGAPMTSPPQSEVMPSNQPSRVAPRRNFQTI